MHIEHLYVIVGNLGLWVLVTCLSNPVNNRDRHKLAVRRKGRSLLSLGLQPKLKPLFLTKWDLGKVQKYNKK